MTYEIIKSKTSKTIAVICESGEAQHPYYITIAGEGNGYDGFTVTIEDARKLAIDMIADWEGFEQANTSAEDEALVSFRHRVVAPDGEAEPLEIGDMRQVVHLRDEVFVNDPGEVAELLYNLGIVANKDIYTLGIITDKDMQVSLFVEIAHGDILNVWGHTSLSPETFSYAELLWQRTPPMQFSIGSIAPLGAEGKHIMGTKIGKISKDMQYSIWTDGTVHYDWASAIKEHLTSQGITFLNDPTGIVEENRIKSEILKLAFAQQNWTLLNTVLYQLEESRKRNMLPPTNFREMRIIGADEPKPEGFYKETELLYHEMRALRREERQGRGVTTLHKEARHDRTFDSGVTLEVNHRDFCFGLDSVRNEYDVLLYLPNDDKSYVRHYAWWTRNGGGREEYPVSWVSELPPNNPEQDEALRAFIMETTSLADWRSRLVELERQNSGVLPENWYRVIVKGGVLDYLSQNGMLAD